MTAPTTMEEHARALQDARLRAIDVWRFALNSGIDSAFYSLKRYLKQLFPDAYLAFYDEDTHEFVIVTPGRTYRYA